MSGAWTPGPWAVVFRRDGSSYINMGSLLPGQKHKQFDLLLRAGEGNDEADAHLISSAPDLYAALESLADEAEQYRAILGALARQSLSDARAALAKARGETK